MSEERHVIVYPCSFKNSMTRFPWIILYSGSWLKAVSPTSRARSSR